MTLTPYYTDDAVTLYHGNALEIDAWLTADVLVTDPPYGIGWTRPPKPAHSTGGADAGHPGIMGDEDTSARDVVLKSWGQRPGVVFGSFYAPFPSSLRQVLVYEKAPDAGVIGSKTGYRRDAEPIFLTGRWPVRPAYKGSVLTSNARGAGHLAARHGHPHAKPVDVLEQLLLACPPGVVADPFAGSGSTLVAARNLGRRVIGVELDERYCEVIAKRLAQDVLPLEVASA